VLANQIGMIIRASGENPTEARIKDIIKKANEKDGTVSFEEFVAIMQDLRATDKKLSTSDVEGAFRVFDSGKTGMIPAAELKHILTSFGEKLSEEEAEELLGIVETTADGQVDYVKLAAKMVS